MDDSPNWITPLYAGLLGILLLVLSYNVSRQRLGNKVAIGDGGVPALQRAIRAQANLTEYAPLALILLAGIEAQGFSGRIVHFLGILLLAGRLLHGFGLTRSAGPSAPRAMGASLTWLMILLAAGLAIFGWISPSRF
jgi:uncharacterized membrane protein YecN with MAPEG domain